MSIMIIFTIILSFCIILLSYIISHRIPYPIPLGVVTNEGERKSQYECGIEPFEEEIGLETRERFFIKFYIIGIIFLIFDLESLLLYPITVIFYKNIIKNKSLLGEINFDLQPWYKYENQLNWVLIQGYIVFLIFILILILGLLYEYKKKVI